jgi:hypothetical protein
MALVTYLKIKGCVTGRPRWAAGTCYWSFEPTSELRRLVELFTAKSSLVEPTEYNKIFGETKREFYDTRPALAEA